MKIGDEVPWKLCLNNSREELVLFMLAAISTFSPARMLARASWAPSNSPCKHMQVLHDASTLVGCH